MKIIESFLTKNRCYISGVKITVKGLMLHSVGCAQPSASVFVKNFNSGDCEVCVHGFIDAKDGTVYQTLPWDRKGWHGGGNCNNTHIGIEMCEPDCIKYTSGAKFTCSDKVRAKEMVKKAYDSAVELFAYLCEKYNLNPKADGVIVSHSEGNKRGIATAHADPEHLWKQLGTGYTMDGFRDAVKAAMSGEKTAVENTSVSTKDNNTSASATMYCCQVGAFEAKKNADAKLVAVESAGFDACVVKDGTWHKVHVGSFKDRVSANKMLLKLNAAGFTAIVVKSVGQVVTSTKSIDEIAREVISGKWGNGQDRVNRLKAAGYNPTAVQKKVNELLK